MSHFGFQFSFSLKLVPSTRHELKIQFFEWKNSVPDFISSVLNHQMQIVSPKSFQGKWTKKKGKKGKKGKKEKKEKGNWNFWQKLCFLNSKLKYGQKKLCFYHTVHKNYSMQKCWGRMWVACSWSWKAENYQVALVYLAFSWLFSVIQNGPSTPE